MAKRISKKDRAELRKARNEIRREFRKNVSKKDKADLSKFKCATKEQMTGSGSAVYCLGFLGALIYFVTTATSIWAAILGVLKAIVWPAFLVYEVMMSLGM